MKKRQLELFPGLEGDKKLLSDLPEFVAEFHPTRNNPKTSYDFTRATSESVWWLCKEGHEWRAPISNRTRLGNGCPYCSGKLPTAERNLAVANPLLSKEWNYTRNKKEPRDFTPRSKTKVWWKCEKGHEWLAAIGNRNSPENTILRGCPYCSNKKAWSENNFAYLHPELSKEWHPNNEMRPEKVLPSSNKKVLWQCSEGHVWRESPRNRSRKVYGCPQCSKALRSDNSRKATEGFNLETENPTVCREWHYEKNESPPRFYMPASNDLVWWICDKGHEWRSTVYSRTKPEDGVGSGCPYCSGRRASAERNLAINHPEIAAEWHPTKNKLSPTQMTPASSKKVWWLCERGHEWKTDVATRTLQGSGCPSCSNQSSKNEIRILTELNGLVSKVQSRQRIDGLEMDVFLPQMSVAIEYDGFYWHSNKIERDKEKQELLEARGIKVLRIREAPLPPLSDHDIIVPSSCLLSKEILNSLVREIGLNPNAEAEYLARPDFLNEDMYREYLDFFPSPFPEKSLASLFPVIAAEWHPTKNIPLTPTNFNPGAGYSAWWQCKRGHEWKAVIGSRTSGQHRCPYCSGRKATLENCMAATRPDMAAVWHPTKNGDATPSNTKAGAAGRRWWRCSKNPEHEWQQTPDKLQHLKPESFCPHCRKEQKPPLSITHPEIAQFWHPTKNGTKTPNNITGGSSTRRWWICPDNPKHEWQNSPYNLTRPERKLGYCPFCSGRRRLRG